MHFATRRTEVIEPITQITHEGVPSADDLRTGERLEATHRSRPPFEMLMVALNALLLQLAPDVHDLRHDCCKRQRIDCPQSLLLEVR